MRKINQIILHCSDSDYPQHDNVETIRQWHLERGWKDIGYHYIITKDGRIRWGRALELYGAHCIGQNKDSIGICLCGRKEFTQAQFKSLQVLILRLMDRYNLTKDDVYGHNHYNKLKSCPNFNIAEALKDI